MFRADREEMREALMSDSPLMDIFGQPRANPLEVEERLGEVQQRMLRQGYDRDYISGRVTEINRQIESLAKALADLELEGVSNE